jgi:hypothetical protein
MLGPQSLAPTVSRLVVVRFSSPETADGAMQWPETRALITERLGPTTVTVAEEGLEPLRKVLAEVGITLSDPI